MVGEFAAESVEVPEDPLLGLYRVVRRGGNQGYASLPGDPSKVGLFQRVPAEQDDPAASVLGRGQHQVPVGHVGTVPALQLDACRGLVGEALWQRCVV